MIAVSTTIEQQAAFRGIKVRTESGKPAKVYTDDAPIAVTTTSGDAVGVVENVTEYTEGERTGTQFDVVLKNSNPGASVLTLTADADADSGEVRNLTMEFNLTTSDLEAASFEIPEVAVEPIA